LYSQASEAVVFDSSSSSDDDDDDDDNNNDDDHRASPSLAKRAVTQKAPNQAKALDSSKDASSRDASSSSGTGGGGGGAQFRTLELRELRKFESLTAFGQNLSEIALQSAEWSPQRRPNKNEKSERADELKAPLGEAERKLRCVPPCVGGGGFDVELPKGERPATTHAITLEETQHEVYLYRDNFIQFNEADQVLTIELEHFHWLGVMTLPPDPGASSKERKQEPIAITISQQDYFGLGRFIGIVRTVRSDHAFSLEASLLGKATQSPKPKVLLAAMRKINPIIKDAKLWFVDDARVCEKLLVFEDVMKYWNYKIGVVYAKQGQTTEEQMLANKVGSPAFERFLALLGERIKLKGWTGYTADLDTKSDASGAESIFTQWHDFSVMFHVSTMLPYDYAENEAQQVARKRYIGNDLVTIIFQDGETPFTPPCIVSNMLHVFVLVCPLVVDGRDCYKVSVVSKRGVPAFGPPVGDSLVFASGPYFREWLLTKLVNAERASLHHPWLSNFIKKTRRGQLEDILKDFVDQHSKPTTKSSSNKGDGAEPVGPIAATAQTVARLKKRNRSQVQSPQVINRATSSTGGVAASPATPNAAAASAAAAAAADKNGAVPTAAGAKFERLTDGAEWICDQCQKRVAVYKVMVATGAQLTLCVPCAETKTEKLQNSASASSVSAAAKAEAAKSDASVGAAFAALDAATIRKSSAKSTGASAAVATVAAKPATPAPAAPAGPAPLPPSSSPAAAVAPSSTKVAPPTSPRSKNRASVSLDSTELDNILTALKRDKLRTPVRTTSGRTLSAAVDAALGSNRGDSASEDADAPGSLRPTAPRAAAATAARGSVDSAISAATAAAAKPNGRSSSLRRVEEEAGAAVVGDAFQSRLAELDRRIQELSSAAHADDSDKKKRTRRSTQTATPPGTLKSVSKDGGESESGDGGGSRGSSTAPPPLPPDSMVPDSVKPMTTTTTTSSSSNTASGNRKKSER
jgi:hypothetical protein